MRNCLIANFLFRIFRRFASEFLFFPFLWCHEGVYGAREFARFPQRVAGGPRTSDAISRVVRRNNSQCKQCNASRSEIVIFRIVPMGKCVSTSARLSVEPIASKVRGDCSDGSVDRIEFSQLRLSECATPRGSLGELGENEIVKSDRIFEICL